MKVIHQRSPITSSREDWLVTRVVLMDSAAPSRALSQELGSLTRRHVATGTVRRRLQLHELSSQRPWLKLPLKLHHRQERPQWCDQQRT
ncbi:HTH_Tnp_Tc3_2 domain-containing protein [Trichonephila clavipes]|nr:HTH_Tnp_Tc3_2 domain-containing protein [Trichonephila clavipes]